MEQFEETTECLYKAGGREVRLVIEKATGKRLVIKKIKFSQMEDKEQTDTITEVQALLKLQHRHIVSYVSSFKDEATRTINIVMSYCPEGDLYDWIEKHREGQTSFPTADIVMIFRQLCEALAYIHSKHTIHRDIKPRNIFVENSWTVKLGDFGISKILESTFHDAETNNKGTFPYTAPEVFGKNKYRHKCDMWSLGCVLYEMITLELPFQATTMRELINQISNDPYPPLPAHADRNLADLVAELLHKDPSERPNAEQILARQFVHQQPPSQTVSGVEFRQLKSMFDQVNKKVEGLGNQIEGMNKQVEGLGNQIEGMNKKVEGLGNQIEGMNKKVEGLENQTEGMNKKVEYLSNAFEGMKKNVEGLESKFASELNKTKSETFAFIEKEAHLIKHPAEDIPEEYSFDFFIDNFRGLENSGKDMYSMPVYLHIIKSSVVGYVEFNGNGEMIVWLKFSRHPRKVGFNPTKGNDMKIKATVVDIHRKVLPEFVIGILKGVKWDESVITSNEDFGFEIGRVSCKELLDKQYGLAEGYNRGAILVRFDIDARLMFRSKHIGRALAAFAGKPQVE